MLKRTVQANYCAYPAMDTGPMFAGIRSLLTCQNSFLAGRAKIQ
jgi:hypothetical protein